MKILIAEDDAVSRMLLTSMLKKERGYELVAVNDGQAAWFELERNPGFDLAIIDVMMPGLSGFELLERLRHDARFTNLPVILCSALNDRVSVTQAMALKATHYIVKPFARAVVLEKVRSVVLLDSASVLDGVDATCARLGIDVTMWRSLADELASAAFQWSGDAQRATTRQDFKARCMQANALKGASVNLGVVGLAAQFGAAEVALANSEEGSAVFGDNYVVQPGLHSDIAGCVERMQDEIGKLKKAAAAIATAPVVADSAELMPVRVNG